MAPRVLRFLESNCQQYFGVAFATVRLSSVVDDEHVKRFVLRAEEALEKRNYAETLAALRAAFQVFRSNALNDRLTRGTGSLFRMHPRLPSDHDIRRIFKEQLQQEIVGALVAGIRALRDIVELQGLGIKPDKQDLRNVVISHVTLGFPLGLPAPSDGPSHRLRTPMWVDCRQMRRRGSHAAGSSPI